MHPEPEFADRSQEEAFGTIAAQGWEKWEGKGFIALVGPLWLRRVDGRLEVGFLAEERHHNRRGVLQGGMMATFADFALGRTARDDDVERRQATVQLEMQYIDATRIGEFVIARCEVIRRARSLIFVRGLVSAADRPRTAISGIWKVLSA